MSDSEVAVAAPGAIGGAYIDGVPRNCRITAEIEPSGNSGEYGLFLCAGDKADDGYKLGFNPNTRTVRLGRDAVIEAVEGLDKAMRVDIVMKDGIVDVCVDDRRCIINRLSEREAGRLWFYAKQGSVTFKNIRVLPLL